MSTSASSTVIHEPQESYHGPATLLDPGSPPLELEVRLRGTDAAASVVVRGEGGGGGAAVVRLHDLETSALVGAVRPALP